MKFNRVWAMPNKETFKIEPVREFLSRYVPVGGVGWIDPFAGNNSPAETTNDLNPNTNACFHYDALGFLVLIRKDSSDGALFDAPYSPRQLKECYDDIGESLHDTKSSVWKIWKDTISSKVRKGGCVLSFGWQSGGMGLKRGFELEEILLVPHGGNHNDTICVAERKL